jgi:outer membrane PBP1 activator LpoA protein
MLRALHRLSLLLSLTAVLYGGVPSRASEAPDAAPTAASEHVALLLPAGSDAFGKPAEAVRAGFLEGSSKHTGPPLKLRLYPVSDDPLQIVATYRSAIAAGARLVVGPLTRNGVTALAAQADVISVPTLALNVAEGVSSNPPNLYTLSLQIEAEARQVAQLALRDGRSKALTVTGPTPLGRRMRDAFIDEFRSGGGSHIADHDYSIESEALGRLKQAAVSGSAEVVFLALDAPRARAVGPYIAPLQAYGTSQVNPGARAAGAFIDLVGVRFVDMPWMLQPDHPAVLTYGRDASRASDDLERLHALGIDAFRVAQELLAGKRELDIDGVTGHLTLGADGHVKRDLLVALITGGQLVVLGRAKP